MKGFYFDAAASTAVSKNVAKAMETYLRVHYANPNSFHAEGEIAREALEKARKEIALEINAKPHEIYFTSGTTEANNWAIFGTETKKGVAVSAIEHASIIESATQLTSEGVYVKAIPVNREGLVEINDVKKIVQDVKLISVMHANNVIGSVQDISLIGKICRDHGVLFHTDAAQTFGKMKIDVKAMHIDLLSAGAHKLGGPKGVGFLYVREGVYIRPLIFGGGQERGKRGGTENVAGAVGFAAALNEIKKVKVGKIRELRDYLIEEIEKMGGMINGAREQRLYNNVHVSFARVDAGALAAFLSQRGVYVSTGSACDSRKEKEDHVLHAIGLDKKASEGSIRITLSSEVAKKGCDTLLEVLEKGIKVLRH
jgi:cysteine desulfurase